MAEKIRKNLIPIFFCLILLAGCRSMDNGGGTDWATVRFSIAGSSSENRLNSVSGSSIQSETALILAVSGDISGIGSMNYLIDRYDMAQQDIGDGTDELMIGSSAAGGNNEVSGRGIEIDSGGKLVAAGYSHNGTDRDMVIWRFNTDGSADTTFGLNGRVLFDDGNNNHRLDLALDSSGRFVVAARSPGTEDDLAIWRYR